MRASRTKKIVAIVTQDENVVLTGGAPTILVKDQDMQERVASELARILAGNVHGLSNGLILVTEE